MTQTIEQPTATRERPILFSGEMVKAILDGRKTQTRRAVKSQPPDESGLTVGWYHPVRIDSDGHEEPGPETFGLWNADGDWARPSPYGKPGDKLWVRETWGLVRLWTDPETGVADDWTDWAQAIPDARPPGWTPVYRAGGEWDTHRDDRGFNWRPSIHMPRWASRLMLEVTGVRVERLNDIGRDGRRARDVLAEGITPEQIEHTAKLFHADDAPALTYGALWDSINGKGSWKANPWVWVVEFKRVS